MKRSSLDEGMQRESRDGHSLSLEAIYSFDLSCGGSQHNASRKTLRDFEVCLRVMTRRGRERNFV